MTICQLVFSNYFSVRLPFWQSGFFFCHRLFGSEILRSFALDLGRR